MTRVSQPKPDVYDCMYPKVIIGDAGVTYVQTRKLRISSSDTNCTEGSWVNWTLQADKSSTNWRWKHEGERFFLSEENMHVKPCDLSHSQHERRMYL